MKENSRLHYLDLLRILAMFAVMLVHVSASQYYEVPVQSLSWQVFNVYNSLARFCVPVFFMISGVFFLDNSKPLSYKKLFGKYILKLLISYVFWASLYALYAQIGNKAFSFSLFFNSLLNGPSHFWFIYAIIGLYILTPLLRKITEDSGTSKYFLILFFVFCLGINTLKNKETIAPQIDDIMQKLNISFVIGYSGYFVLGYWLYKTDISKKQRLILYALGIISLVFTILQTSSSALKTGTASDKWYYYAILNTALTSMAIFVFFKYNISRISFSTSELKAINLVSKLSFGMYLVHNFINLWFLKIGFTTLSYNTMLSVPLNSIIVFVLSFIIAYIISKIPYLNKYII